MGFTSDFAKLTNATTEYQFEINPLIKPDAQHLQIEHVLDSGLTSSYDKQFKINWTLTWQEPVFFRGSQLESLRGIFNALGGLCFYPAPDTHPSTFYRVRWSNGFDFNLVRGNVDIGYVGVIELEGTEILTSIDSGFVMADIYGL